MPTGLSYEQHNEIIFQIIAILEKKDVAPETRLQQAANYCYGGGLFWPKEALEAWLAYEQSKPPQEGA